MALSAETGELLEILQWLSENESRKLSDERRRQAEEEIGDIKLYLLRLADQLDIDLLQAAEKKPEINEKKYPIHKAKGNARKYTELDS